MAIMQEIETKLQRISVSTDEEVYYALLELVKTRQRKRFQTKERKSSTTYQQSSLSESFYQTTLST